MIQASHRWFFTWFFNFYARYKIKRHFHGVNIHSECKAGDKAILFIANHFSWWDGFFVLYLNQILFRKKFYVMMLDHQLKKNRFLAKTGAFSIKKNSRDILESLQYAQNILENGNNLLLLFPQGKIESMFKAELKFENGIEKIIHGRENQIQLIMAAVLPEYYSNPKPSLFIYLAEFDASLGFTSTQIEKEYNRHFNWAKMQQKE